MGDLLAARLTDTRATTLSGESEHLIQVIVASVSPQKLLIMRRLPCELWPDEQRSAPV